MSFFKNITLSYSELISSVSSDWFDTWTGCLQLVKAKFHHAILVADRTEAGIWPITSSEHMLAGLQQVCRQPRTCLRPG